MNPETIIGGNALDIHNYTNEGSGCLKKRRFRGRGRAATGPLYLPTGGEQSGLVFSKMLGDSLIHESKRGS